MSLSDYATLGEGVIARRLVKNALALGWSISVYDREEWTVRESTDRRTIINALCTTDGDALSFANNGTFMGTVWLVWGNDPDGSELIADHTDNHNTTALVAATERKTA